MILDIIQDRRSQRNNAEDHGSISGAALAQPSQALVPVQGSSCLPSFPITPGTKCLHLSLCQKLTEYNPRLWKEFTAGASTEPLPHQTPSDPLTAHCPRS